MLRGVLAGTVVVTMVAAGCSSSKSSKKAASAPTSASAGTSGTSGTSGTINPSLPPVKIALLGIETGPNATPDRHNAIDLAIQQLNAGSGIAGHRVEYTAYDTGILPQTTVTAVTKAISDNPTFMIGLAVSSGVLAAASLLKTSGIPTIQEGQDNKTDLSKIGVTNMFRGEASVKEQAQAGINFIADQHPTTVGLFDDSDLNGVQTEANIKAGLQAKGINTFISREIAQTATDATEAALAMKPADIITSVGFPAEEAIFVKDLAINGIKARDVMSQSGSTIASFGMAPWSAIAGNYSYTICDPDVIHTPTADAFAQAYKLKYPAATQLATSGANIYDGIMMFAKAVQSANGSLAPADIVKSLSTVSYSGVCGTYQSDAEHTMAHTMYVVQYGQAQGQKTKAAEYDNMPSS